jgi:phosphoserine phosphatase RsbU/P
VPTLLKTHLQCGKLGYIKEAPEIRVIGSSEVFGRVFGKGLWYEDSSVIYQQVDSSEIEQVARRIQSSILPIEFPASMNFRVAARYVPVTSVAGDFYDYIITDDQQVGLLIADVSGHGVPAALIASMVKLAVASQRAAAADPCRFLAGMNSALFGNTQNQFVTAAYVHLNAESGELRYSAAARPPLLLVRNGMVTPIKENGLMLAVFSFTSYSTGVHKLQAGDRIVMYTDGILDASNAAGDFFGPDTLCDLLKKTRLLSPAVAADSIISSVRQWSEKQDDDMTVLILRLHPTNGHVRVMA